MADQSDPNSAAQAELSREEILRQIFGDVGELIDDFTCAVESTVLLHGRMYITTKYICFYSNLFGLEKKIRIPYSHIKSITKENTAMVIPNAIAINTDKRDYLFRSFWDREDCYRILNLFLEKFKTHGRIEITLPRTLSDAPLPSLESVMASTPSNASVPASGIEAAAPPATPTSNIGPITETVDSKRASTKARPVSVIIDTPIEDLLDAESIPKADSDQDLPSMYQSELEKARYKIAVTSGTMDISLKNFMALIVDESAPYSYKRYHESVKDSNLDASKWEEMPSTGSFGREIKFFKPVNLPGLASTRGVKIQKYRKFGDHALLLWSSTRLEDVPAADAFSVDDLLAVQSLGENQISVEISFQVTFLKSTYMKYIIESSSNAEMKKWLEAFFQHLKKITDNFKDGKISLDGPPLAEAIIVDSTSGKEAAPAEPADSSSSAGSKASSGSDSLFALVRNFQNETLGDRIKTILILVLIIFLLYNLFAWRGVHRQMRALESKIVNLEHLLQAAVAKN